MIGINAGTRFISHAAYQDDDENGQVRITPPGTLGIVTSLDSFASDGDYAVWYPETGATGFVEAQDLRNRDLFTLVPAFKVYVGDAMLEFTSIDHIPLEEQQAFWRLQGDGGEMSDKDMALLYDAWRSTQQFHRQVGNAIAGLSLGTAMVVLEDANIPFDQFAPQIYDLRQAALLAYYEGKIDGASILNRVEAPTQRAGEIRGDALSLHAGQQNVEALAKSGRLNRVSPELDAAWDVFAVDGALEIQRLDELAPTEGEPVPANAYEQCFFSDLEAVGYALMRAVAGDKRAADALRKVYAVDVAAHAPAQEPAKAPKAVPPSSVRPWVILEDLINLANEHASKMPVVSPTLEVWQSAAESELGHNASQSRRAAIQRTQSFLVFAASGSFDWPELMEPGKANDLLMMAARDCDMAQFVRCDAENVGVLKSFGDIIVGSYDHARGGIEVIALPFTLEKLAEHPADFKVEPIACAGDQKPQQASEGKSLASSPNCPEM